MPNDITTSSSATSEIDNAPDSRSANNKLLRMIGVWRFKKGGNSNLMDALSIPWLFFSNINTQPDISLRINSVLERPGRIMPGRLTPKPLAQAS
ncbi:hypothetical protein [Haliea sp.]|uniref:hypothetical protein n=1 Tax=Haliea sp. TaxID=1932666 RepID=UPI003528B5CF